MQRNMLRTTLLISAALATLALSGCTTVTTLASHHEMEVKSQVSNSIFLQPLPPAQKTVFVQVHNTSAKPGLNIVSSIDQKLQSEGWNVVQDPSKANVILQANILQAGKAQQNAIQSAVQAGYGAGVVGTGATAAGLAGLAGGGVRGVGAAALASGAADFVGGLLVKDVYYALTADVQISRRGLDGQTYTVTHARNSESGALTHSIQNVISMAGGNQISNQGSSNSDVYTEKSHFKQYSTRIVASAEKVNLNWQEAAPALQDKLVATIGGIL